MASIDRPPPQAAFVDRALNILQPWRLWMNHLYAWIRGIGLQNYTVDFGAAPANTATVTLTNQPWVTAQSVITANVLCPAGVAPATFNGLGMKVVISDIAANTFKITLFTSVNTTGAYIVSVVGSD